jgi:drug/metabolite transporter (DMT)-like permease
VRGINLPLLAAAATGVQVGAVIVASRLIVAEVQPATLALLRYATGFTVMLTWMGVLRQIQRSEHTPPAQRASEGITFKPRMKDAIAIALLGIGQFGLLIALMNWGLQRIGAAPAAMIFSLFPLFTLLLAASLGREQLHGRLISGVMLSITGVACALWPKLMQSSAHDWLGEMAVLGTAVLGAVCSVLYRPYLRRYPLEPLSAFAMFAAVLSLVFMAWPEHWLLRLGQWDARIWLLITGIGLSSGIAYLWWMYALKHESPTRVTVFLALSPVTAALLAAPVLHESVPLSGWLGMVIVVIGLRLATR